MIVGDRHWEMYMISMIREIFLGEVGLRIVLSVLPFSGFSFSLSAFDLADLVALTPEWLCGLGFRISVTDRISSALQGFGK